MVSPTQPLAKVLKDMQERYTFLSNPDHDLYSLVEACQSAINDGDEERGADALARLEQAVEHEEKTLEAAFRLFTPGGQRFLSRGEVEMMLEYLGFPSSASDVDKVLKAADKDGDGTVCLPEFQEYVGKMGGSFKLFELRRKQIANHGTGGEVDRHVITADLRAAGILDQEQAYWNLVLPRAEYEFQEAVRLTNCQRKAVRHIRMLAKSNHERALPLVQRKLLDLGYSDNDLWMTLAYIRELAPIIIHVNLDRMLQYFKSDTHYRNQFETATSGGLLKPDIRKKWEHDLFGGSYDKVDGFQRPKYGVLNVMNDYRGVVKCKQYGESYLVLKDCRLRCTFSPEDSANLKADRLAVLDYYAHVLHEYSKDELIETISIAKSSEAAVLGDSDKVGKMKYKEAQLHGEIRWDTHVDRLVAKEWHRDAGNGPALEAICKAYGWRFTWMDEERKRMQEEEVAKLGEAAWKEKLAAIMEKGSPDVKGVPKGFCKKGCGRKVAPGTTAAGHPFSTCCRGCALGFGHDLVCGNIDAEKVKPGLCLNGCGRPVRPGTTKAGRRWSTCCRSCGRGDSAHHDEDCGKHAVPHCKMRCGRLCAPPKDGRHFNTCCRGCAKSEGKDHSKDCTPAPDGVVMI